MTSISRHRTLSEMEQVYVPTGEQGLHVFSGLAAEKKWPILHRLDHAPPLQYTARSLLRRECQERVNTSA